jgi:hypothetical protein
MSKMSFIKKYIFTPIFLVLGAALCSSYALVHDFHSSITQLEYNPKQKLYEISISLFRDDLELALSQATKQKISLEKAESKASLLEAYIRKNFKLKTKTVNLNYHFIGTETDEPSVWIYLELKANPAQVKSLTAQVSSLTEIFSDQTNIVNILEPNAKRSYIFDKRTTTQQLK